MALDLGTLVARLGVDQSDLTSGLQGALGDMGAFGKAAGVAGGVAGAALIAGVVEGMDREKANDKLAAQLGLSAGESKRIGGIAGALYADAYGESLGEVNTAVGAVLTSIKGMSKASSAELEDVTAKAMDYANTFEIDVARAAQVAGQAVKTGLAKDATEAFDLLTAASQRVPAALREDVVDAADEYGQFFATLGYNGKEAFALLVDASADGMYGIDKAGDAIKEFTIRSTDMSTASKDAYATIGLDARSMANQILAGGDTAQGATQKIIDGLLAIKDPAAQGEAAIALFGTPLEDLNTAEIPAFLESMRGGSKAMDGFKGSAEEMGDTLNDNAVANLTKFKRGVVTAFVDIVGGRALPIVNQVAAALADKLGPALEVAGDVLATTGDGVVELSGFLSEHQTALTVVAGIITAIYLPALIAMGVQSTVAAVKVVAAWVMQQAAALGYMAVYSASVALMVAGWVVMGAQALLGAAKVAAAWLIALGPIGLAIAAIAGVVFLVVKYWDDIKRFTKAAWDWVVDKVREVPGYMLAVFQNFTLPGLIWKHWDSIKSGTRKAWDWVVGKVKAIPRQMVSFFMNWSLPGLIIKHWDKIKSGTIRKATETVNWVKGLPRRYVSALAALGGMLFDRATTAFQRFRDGAGNKVSALIEWAGGIPERITKKLSGLAGLLKAAGVDAAKGLWEGLKSMGGWLEDKVWDWVKSVLPKPVEKALGISSPSRVMRDLARWVPAGMALGLDDGAPVLDAAVARMAAQVATVELVPAVPQIRSSPPVLGAAGGYGHGYGYGPSLAAQPAGSRTIKIDVHDRSGDPARTARETARLLAMAGGG